MNNANRPTNGKGVVVKKYIDHVIYICPNCHIAFLKDKRSNYCCNCGLKFDFSELKEE